MPPRLVRRILVGPLLFVLAILLLLLSPIALVAAAVADLFLPGSFRTTRLLAVVVVFLFAEVAGMVTLSVLWVASGFGVWLHDRRFVDAHHRFVGWWLTRLTKAATRFCGLRIEIEDAPAPQAGAVLVFPRHAGPGDSILIAHTLIAGFSRRPRIVMKDTLQWSPTIDIAGNRLDGCFIRPSDRRANRFVERIGELAAGLGVLDAFVLFPEGGNFSLRRREGAIGKLRESGHVEFADRAERMSRVIAPRPGGALAAIAASRHADVVFVAHTGLEYLGTLSDLWRSLPLTEPIIGRYWRLPPDEVPEGREEQIDWLYGWWGRIDDWIGAHTERYRSWPGARSVTGDSRTGTA